MSEKFDVETLNQLRQLLRDPIMDRLNAQDEKLNELQQDIACISEDASKRWEGHEVRIGKLESNQSRTFWIWGGIAGVVTVGANALWFKIEKLLGWK